ncbi:hypothetical protein GCM10009557_62010 [Virgisporangium ochraceum]|uniref:YcxB-like protein domain-containing protein n=1 Tax=Virgisporangium ochraceum TaxID=65505 RepID=A0A8J4EB23_9ACTN|nr:hypothetical protein [Virgisporangium ochraceum]GIJ68008.1 hypothetical protein Voc01_029250 [Virgisporangium ochraceum]
MSTPPPDVDGAVRLTYALTVDDLTDGLLAQSAAHRPRFLRSPLFLTAVAALALAILLGDALVFHVAGLNVVAVLIGWVVAIAGLVFVVHRVSDATLRRLPVGARVIFGLTARILMRGTPTLAERTRTVVDGTGLHVTAETAGWTAAWAQYPVHRETDGSFALFASDRTGAQIVVLPKRGLAEPDAERLRALLATHSRRLA